MTQDEIRLVIPAEEEFRPIAHLVTGGLALRLDLTYDDLEDLQVAIEALVGLRDDEDAGGAGLDLRRVLDKVTDSHEIETRDDGAWVQLSKRIATTAGAA